MAQSSEFSSTFHEGPLSDAQLHSFRTQGYVAVPDLIPGDLLEAVVVDVCAGLGADLEVSQSWYTNDPANYTQVPIHHPQSFWNVRQYEPLYRAFVQLWEEEDLLVSIDRASFKPPWSERHREHNLGRRIHWDLDPLGVRRQIQGVVYLTDNQANGGCFECVPGVHVRAIRWAQDGHLGPEGYFRLLVKDAEVRQVCGARGTVVFFDSRLPHGSSANYRDRPRLAQYVQMFPRRDEPDVTERLLCWEGTKPPRWSVEEGWVGLQDPEPYPRPRLTPLGRRLLGFT